MKRTKALFSPILILIFLMTMPLLSTGQTEIIEGDKLLAKATSSNDKVMLRWLPTNKEVWQVVMDNGIEISRFTIAIDGNTLSNYEQYQSKTVVADNIVPMPVGAWPDTDKGNLAEALVHDNGLNYTPSAANNLADAIQQQETEESKFLFAMLLADQDFEMAKNLGLGFEDPSVKSDETYSYRIKVKNGVNTLEVKNASIVVTHTGSSELPSPTEVEGTGGNLEALISWNTEQIEDVYTYYNIERSTDGQNFEVRNPEPFIFISDSEIASGYAFFRDSLDDNTTTYYYRVVGLSPFGMSGAPSEVITVKGLPPKMDFQLSIDNLELDQNENFVVHWASLPATYNSNLDHFNVLRIIKIDDTPQVMNTSPLPPSSRSFTVDPTVAAAYYILEAVDVNGHRYRSTAMLGQLSDTSPPLAPQSLRGKIFSNGIVSLEWDENTEEDLKGYQVLYSNARDGVYIQITSTAIKKAKYEHRIDLKVGIDSFFCKVIAVDKRYNVSEESNVLALVRPDNIAPSSPVLTRVLPKPEGIRIYWILSSSEDASDYVLQRKQKAESQWQNVLTFSVSQPPQTLPLLPGESTPANFIDTEDLKNRMYQYRLTVYDVNKNGASSHIKEVIPYDDGIRGNIVDETAIVIEPNGDGTISGSSGTAGTSGDSEEEIIFVRLDKDEKLIRLNWAYESTAMTTLKSFKVYRQIVNTSEPIIYNPDGTPDEPPYLLIKTLKDEIAVNHATSWGYEGYLFDNIVSFENPDLVYNYKIMAEHRDGGWSEFSDIISISN